MHAGAGGQPAAGTPRRDFCRACALAAAAAWLPSPAGAAPLRSEPVDPDTDRYVALIDEVFTVRGADGAAVALRLAAATRGPVRNNPEQAGLPYRSLSLRFIGPVDRTLVQGIHAFEHPDIGREDLFVAPVGPGGPQGPCYEVLFNRPLRRSLGQAV